MAANKNFIAAIELGSTKITGIAGTKNPNGSISIAAYAAEYSTDCIKRGNIYNIDKTAKCVSRIIEQLEEKLEASIKKIYVGIGGMSMRTISNTIVQKLPEDTKISQALIDEMMAQNKSMHLGEREILAVTFPQEYKIGNTQTTTEPVGTLTDRIEGHYLNVVARTSVKQNISQCFRQTNYDIADYLLAPIATADAVLYISEKRSGCALVDLGAETTTVSIYKSNTLKHLAVIPLGSNNITQDLTSLKMETDDAERMKKRFGKAYLSPEENKEIASKEYKLEGKYPVPASVFNRCVTARQTEIIENVWNQIKLSGYSDQLMGGIILTGGGAKMVDIDRAFTVATKIDKIRIAQESPLELEYAPMVLRDGMHNTLIGLLNNGKENCRKIEQNEMQSNFLEEMEREAEAEKRLKKYSELFAKATQQYNENDYEKALGFLTEAEALHIAEKTEEIEKLKIQIADKQAEEAEKRAEEIYKSKLEKYNQLVEEAKHLLNSKKYKEAGNKAEEADAIGLPDKEEETAALKKLIAEQKRANNTFTKWTDLLKKGIDEITGKEE